MTRNDGFNFQDKTETLYCVNQCLSLAQAKLNYNWHPLFCRWIFWGFAVTVVNVWWPCGCWKYFISFKIFILMYMGTATNSVFQRALPTELNFWWQRVGGSASNKNITGTYFIYLNSESLHLLAWIIILNGVSKMHKVDLDSLLQLLKLASLF